jgi:KipI family sensor histidine kinase inhibitor
MPTTIKGCAESDSVACMQARGHGPLTDVRAYGADALLAGLDDPRVVPALAVAASSVPGVVEVIPGARTLTVRLECGASGAAVAAALWSLRPVLQPAAALEPVVLPVSYDGADLDDVAKLTGLGRDEVVALHASATYTVRFCGFAPGFGYLDGLDERLHVARRDQPRTSVPAGSVAIAGEFTGVYPRSSPGGWRLLGRTEQPLWDLARTPPALLAPGTTVRFVAL